jgi:SprT protein
MFDAIENPETSLPITTQVRNRVEECFVTAEKFYNQKLPRCTINFELTGTKAGTANYGKKLLRFNRKLLVDNPEHFFKDTIPHEVAHIVDIHFNYKQGWSAHGRSWQKVMIEVFRIPPKRCHNLDTSKVKRKTKQFIYLCGCPGRKHPCGQIRHNKIKKNAAQYKCKYCLQTITFEGKAKTLDETKPKGMMSSVELD